jgi:hypothetical protein
MKRAGLSVLMILGLGLGLSGGAPAVALADHSFLCPDNTRRVRVGQHLMEVLRICGDPDFTSQRVEQRKYKYRTGRRCHCHHEEITEERVIEVLVDDWVYDFGRNRHARYLRFENNFLASIGSRWIGSY